MKFLKNPLILILIFLIISISAIGVIKSQARDVYSELEKVNYDQVLEEEKPTIYYYFQTTCHFCESIKGELTKFIDAIPDDNPVEVKLVDMRATKNTTAWYDWDAHRKKYGANSDASANPNYISDPKQMKKIDDIKITGTPTMIYVKDGQVIDYQVGPDVFKILNNVVEEFDLNVNLDSSVYGKQT